jgi:hypothetical protein
MEKKREDEDKPCKLKEKFTKSHTNKPKNPTT